MIIPRDFINLLLARIDLVGLIHAQIPLKKKSGSNFFACCPFHNEKTGSFSVSQTKQFYYCFGCGAHGNAIDFIMQYDHLSFPEAVEILAKQIGLELPQTSQVKYKESSHLKLYEANTFAAQHFYEQLRKSLQAINYLKHRKITGLIAKEFMLGYAPPNINICHLDNQEALDQRNLLDAGLIIKRPEGGSYDRFRNRIVFPIQDYQGRIIGFGGRILEQGEPKYLNSPETPLFQKGRELYGLFQVLKRNRKLSRILIVEGYMDVIALFQHGVTYTVAALGTATTEYHIQRLLRYTAEIVFCFDGDPAGRTAAWRALQVMLPFMQDNLQARFLFLPEGEDPDSLINKEGRTQFEKKINEAMPLSVFFFQKLSAECDMTTLEGRAHFAGLALDYIKLLPVSLYQGILIDELAKKARISAVEIWQQLPQIKSASLQNSSPKVVKPRLHSSVRLAIALLMQQPRLALLITEPLPSIELPGFAFFVELAQFIQKHPSSTAAGLLEQWRNKKEHAFMAKLLSWEHLVPENGVEEAFLGTMRQLALVGFNNEINRLLARAAQNELSLEEKTELANWINKKKHLQADKSSA